MIDQPVTGPTAGSVPRVVDQALRDRHLRPVDRLAMYVLCDVLDFVEYRECKTLALAVMLGVEDQTAGRALRTLVERGYLDEHDSRKPRAFRLPFSRRVTKARAA